VWNKYENYYFRRVYFMSKLCYGREKQVCFKDEKEKREAFEYMLTSTNVNINVHEDNQNQGAWASEDRIHFKNEEGVPDCLKRQMTAGRPGLYGRINCKELCDELQDETERRNLRK
jgi:hypothetical protein